MEYTYKEYECGCEIATDNMGSYEIEYCPKHDSAPDLYEALKEARITLNVLQPDGSAVLREIDKALADKEG